MPQVCCMTTICGCGSEAHRLFRFPVDVGRRQLWTSNCRRVQAKFTPTNSHRLCQLHFDDAQFESHREDGVRKLRPDAVPMLFAVSSVKSVLVKRKKTATEYDTDEHIYSKRSFPPSCPVNSSVEQVLLDPPGQNTSSDLSMLDGPCDDVVDVHLLQLEIQRLKSQVQQAKKREETLIASISKFLNADQLTKLQQPADQKSRINWSSETIQRCLGIRAVVGRNGYEHLRHLKFPLPSYRTLCRRVQCAPFAPGIQHDVLAWLKLKMEVKPESEKVCVLLIDEMQLKPQLEYDDGLQKMTGYVSPEALPSEAASGAKMEVASHAMIFMLRGLTSSWKQTVAYLFTGTSVKPEPLWEFTKQVIVASEMTGFKIQGVTSDMGPANTGLWKHVGIKSTRALLTPTIPHPVSSERILYFLADPPHLLKNLWNCVLTNRIILCPEIVQKHSLPTNVVTGIYVHQLFFAQNCHELRLAHKLKECHLTPTQYQKMRVCYAAQFFSRSTAAAMQTCVKFDLLPVEALTTAWFLGFVNDWFDIVNAKRKEEALFCGASAARVEVLSEMLAVVKGMSFNEKTTWKPIQTGLQLSTTAVLQLSQQVMKQHHLRYFLSGRLSQDPVENLFSQARGQGVMHPSCLAFRQALRLITVAQYLHVSKGSYDEDSCTYLVDYLKDSKTVDEDSVLHSLLVGLDELEETGILEPEVFSNQDQLEEVGMVSQEFVIEQEDIVSTSTTAPLRIPLQSISNTCRPLDPLEENALYDVMGWAAHKFLNKVKCDTCRSAFSSSESDDNIGQYTTARTYGGLTNPSKDLVNAAKLAEQVFCSSRFSLHKGTSDQDIVQQALVVIESQQHFTFPQCHNALPTIIKKFVRMRLNEHARSVTSDNKAMKRQYGSKTACRITSIS